MAIRIGSVESVGVPPPIIKKIPKTTKLIHTTVSSGREGLPLEPSPSTTETLFEQQRHEYLKKHEDEPKPRDTGPYSFAIVSRAYRELCNGNLTEKLKSLAVQQIPTNELKAYIAVNNIRLWAIASGVVDQHQEIFSLLPNRIERVSLLRRLVGEEYERLELTMSHDERYNMELYINSSWDAITKRINDFKENQATLGILREITTTVNALPERNLKAARREDIDPGELLIAEALDRIRELGRDFLGEAQIEDLLQTSRQILKKRIAIMGIDCSSKDKSYDKPNHGKATNEAIHMAVSQKAKFVDVTDMDEYHSPDALVELYKLAETEQIDIFIRPLLVVTPQHPEQIEESNNIWGALMDYYSSSLGDLTLNYDVINLFSTGVLVVSADAFCMHPYPEIDSNEDYEWDHVMNNDRQLKRRFAITSNLLLGHRGRDISWDGNVMINIHTPRVQANELRLQISDSQRALINSFIRFDRNMHNTLTELNRNHPRLPNFLQIYYARRKNLFESNQERRADARRVFLGVKRDGSIDNTGTLARLYQAYLQNKQATSDEVIKLAHLKHQLGAFFIQNPLIVPGAIQEIRRLTQENGGIALPLEKVIKHIESTLPELFAPPLSDEPFYSQEYVSSIPNEAVNVTDWIHIHQAIDSFGRYIGNLQIDGELSTYPDDARSILEKYLPYRSV